MTTPAGLAPSLEAGDRMGRAEFHRRFSLRPDLRRAELVEGVVHVPSPAHYEGHDEPVSLCVALLKVYASRHPGVRSGASGTVLLDDRNEVQPDAFLWRPEPGLVRLGEQDYIEGAPQLVVEVALSSVSYDLHDKREAYRRNGVGEYLVWRVHDRMITLFRLQDGHYIEAEPDERGVVESRTFPGLRFDLPRMLAGDAAAALAALG